MINVLIRVDASARIGTGHVMRCMALAEQLRKAECHVHFACRELEGNLIATIRDRGYLCHAIEDDGTAGDWRERDAASTIRLIGAHGPFQMVVVDHYELDEHWERELRTVVKRLMVIDDLADRKHSCDILLDQNYDPRGAARYERLVPSECRMLLGPSYLLLRTEFYEARSTLHVRDIREIKRILLFFGGSDPTDETSKALEAVRELNHMALEFDVVVGLSNPKRQLIEHACTSLENVRYHCQVDNMAALMAQADFSVGAGGVTMWERCYMGLPSAVIMVADNQIESAQAAASQGAIWNMGLHAQVNAGDIAAIMLRAARSAEELSKMRRDALRMVASSPEATTNRAINAIMEVGFVE